MQNLTQTQMDQIQGGIDYECATSGWVAVGVVVGSFGGVLGALGGGYLGYEACKAWNA